MVLQMKYSKLFTGVLFSVFLILGLNAAENKSAEKPPTKVKFRSGEAIAAEITSLTQNVSNLSRFEQSTNIKNKLYAVIFLKLDKGRSIGIYDYVLSDGNTEYQCAAIKESIGEPFDNSKWEYATNTDGKTYMMLFIVNGPLPKDKPVKYTLKSKLFDNTIVNPVIEFKNIGAAAFSNPINIPAEGNIGVAPPPAPVAAAPAKPATPAPAAAPPAKPATPAPAPAAAPAKPATPAAPAPAKPAEPAKK